MIESIENALQITVLLACAGIAIIRAAAYRSRKWTMLFFFYGSWVLADIYWLACLVFYDHTPQIPVVSDLAWYNSLIFLYMLLRLVAPPEGTCEKRVLPWMGFLFAAGMAVFYIQWGQIVSNLIYASLMGLLLFSAIRRLLDARRYAAQRFLCVMILVLCLLEYALWTTSCFVRKEGVQDPYLWFDFLLTVSHIFLIPATGKVAAK